MDMQPIDPNQPISAAITAQEWNALLTAATSEHLVASSSLVNKVMAQLRQRSQMSTEAMAEQMGENGVGSYENAGESHGSG